MHFVVSFRESNPSPAFLSRPVGRCAFGTRLLEYVTGLIVCRGNSSLEGRVAPCLKCNRSSTEVVIRWFDRRRQNKFDVVNGSLFGEILISDTAAVSEGGSSHLCSWPGYNVFRENMELVSCFSTRVLLVRVVSDVQISVVYVVLSSLDTMLISPIQGGRVDPQENGKF